MNRLTGAFISLSKWLDYIGRLGFFILMVLITVNVILRYTWQSIGGTYDYVKLICAVSVAASIAFAAYMGTHISIELFVMRLTRRVQAVVESIVTLFSILFFVIAAWRVFVLAFDMQRAHEASLTIYVPYAPFVYFIGVGLSITVFVLLYQFIQAMNRIFRPQISESNHEESRSRPPKEHQS